jgi:hypothetical protein
METLLKLLNCTLTFVVIGSLAHGSPAQQPKPVTVNKRLDGYSGIWYMNQPSQDEYVYKYSGGLGTYCAKHKPLAVYAEKVNKTFFVYGGALPGNSRRLVHMVSYFDHETGMVPKPVMLLDKQTDDAHDNPVLSIDAQGYLWVFSTSHGRSRPSYIHRSTRPYEIREFAQIQATVEQSGEDALLDNFSYLQVWFQNGMFASFFTHYNDPAGRTLFYMNSAAGKHWSDWTRLAAIDEGHYHVSAVHGDVAGVALNYHPKGKGLNWRTNLYYIQSSDYGRTWTSAAGEKLTLPLNAPRNAALIADYERDGKNVYMKDIRYDDLGRPVILYLTSDGYQAGPKGGIRHWMTVRWTGHQWVRNEVTTSDSNYDMGSLYLEPGKWRVIAPTATGPQPFNPGGEIAMWESDDHGATWKQVRQLTRGSEYNHTYVRAPLNAHPDFYAIWADGHGRKPSDSRIYFCTQDGRVFRLPAKMMHEMERPVLVE